jgi:hypothetical protein
MKKKSGTQTGWAIAYSGGLYVGWWQTRKDAVSTHCDLLGRTWQDCKDNGDRVVKITITW